MRGAIILLLAMVAGAANAEIYKFVDKDGVINYSNFRPASGGYEVLHFKCRSCKWRNSVDWNRVPLNVDAYRAEILEACRQHGLEEALVRAIIHAESSFRHSVVSDMGAQGLMQLMPGTAQQYGVRRPFDPRDNILGGTAYLRFLLDLFDNDIKLAAAAYNAGENAVKKHRGIPPYTETRNFVGRVETLHRRYSKAIVQPAGPAAP